MGANLDMGEVPATIGCGGGDGGGGGSGGGDPLDTRTAKTSRPSGSERRSGGFVSLPS